MQPRRGFTLIEVLIAVVLIDVGLLALVAGCSVLVRQTNEIKARLEATRVASNRVEQLSAGSCTSSAGSADGARDVHEEWTVTPAANTTRVVSDSVTFYIGRTPRSFVLRTRLPC